MCEEVGVHFQQGATFENERGESDFGEVHTDAHLEERIQILILWGIKLTITN